MPRGGARPGAGRKSNAETERMRKLFDANMTEKDWRDALKGIVRAAKKGNAKAMDVLLRYRFGLPRHEEGLMPAAQLVRINLPPIDDSYPPAEPPSEPTPVQTA